MSPKNLLARLFKKQLVVNVLCFRCANIFAHKLKHKLTCPHCSYSVDTEDYIRIYYYAKNAIYFGHIYKKAYQDQKKKQGKITSKYHIPDVDQAAIWLGMALLSGIIGNIGTDVAKKVFKIIARRVKDKNGSLPENIGTSEPEINILVENLLLYVGQFNGVDKEVRETIIEEMIVHKLNNKRKDNDKLYVKARSEKEALKVINKIAIETIKIHKKYGKEAEQEVNKDLVPPPKDTFSGFWDKIDFNNSE
ncbi:MAG: hypothetical protein KKC30_12290 [Proteobacteria bacterium]|nr:hypothetical protein [Pseudomonadota bacterium]MBU4384484.1 hypothetical protein [Pseudomonadota bacterium]MCG2766367.1 hypothetical protein [Desulfarculaceae bacterium]